MKKTYAAITLLLIGIVITAVWFSPLATGGDVFSYDDNEAIEKLDGLCYADDSYVRVDLDGDKDDMADMLKRIGAVVVKEAEIDDMLIVYAYSPRVTHCEKLQGGEVYNVMAAYSDGHISIGTPVLSGCY